jgi:hypothetical protein
MVHMEAHSLTAVPVVLALELSEGETLPRVTLSRDEAAELASLAAIDLHALAPEVDDARFALAGALFDPVELLRPGFPLWSTLDELARRVPRGHLENVVAFGTHGGRMPMADLEPDPGYSGGALQLLPLVLLATPALAGTLSEKLEVELVGRGEAGTRTADWLMRTLGVRLDHARYLSRNDLLAMVCVQYEYVNLAPLWSLLEVALLAPAGEEQVLSTRGLPLRYTHGGVVAQSPAEWLRRSSMAADERAHAFAGIVFELRQYAALLDAHRLPLSLEAGTDREVAAGPGYLLEAVGTSDPAQAAPLLLGHEAPGLGVVAVTVAQPCTDREPTVLAHGYPLRPGALGALVEALAVRFGIAAELHTVGRVVLDAQGRLAGDVPGRS